MGICKILAEDLQDPHGILVIKVGMHVPMSLAFQVLWYRYLVTTSSQEFLQVVADGLGSR